MFAGYRHLTWGKAWHQEDQQELLVLAERADYPQVQIWPWMRLRAGRERYAKFCEWHNTSADTRPCSHETESAAL